MAKSYISTYSYECEIAFNDKDGGSTEILKDCVKYILIDHDFKKRIMPVIYLKLNITEALYNKMVPQQGLGKIYLNIYRTRKTGSTSSAAKKVIYDAFEYYMTDDPNAHKTLDTEASSIDNGTSYRTCYIGLIKSELYKQNKKNFEGVFKDTNIMSLVQNATNGMKMVIQPFVNNTELKSFTCPAVLSVGQFISYLNSQYSFYNGAYIYYMDFDKTYLRSNDGSYIDAQDDDLRYIAIDVRDLSNHNSFVSGQIADDAQDAYVIYISASDAQISVDRVTSELTGTVSAVSSSTGEIINATQVDTSAITNIASDIEANAIITSIDPNAASNAATRISENTNTLVITKADMDARIFTPNKQYLLCNYEDNAKYCGVYYLVEKKEVYLRTGAQLTCQMTITLKKCAEFNTK